jgi:hypothetical protein
MFKIALVQAYQDRCQKIAQNQADRKIELQTQAISTLQTWMASLGVSGYEISPERDWLIVDTLCLRYVKDQDTGQILFALKDSCPHCNAFCWSSYYYDPPSLGEQIVNFHPGPNHECHGYKLGLDYNYRPRKTWRENLIDAIEEAILAHVSGE